MWQRILDFFRRSARDHNLLTEFEDSLMLIVDSEQLTNNLLSKLNDQETIIEKLQGEIERLQNTLNKQRADLENYLASLNVG